jgi:alpha-ribazole phosphatase/probable phosphoglycerate mutase
MAVTLVFETHAISEDNEHGIATGWLPGTLSDAGRREAQKLGERRRADNIVVVFTSDLHRAVATAEIAFAGTGVPIFRDARLRECNYGAMNGVPVAQFAGRRRQRIDEPFPFGESYSEVVARVHRFLDEITASHEGKRIVVIGHSATLWSLEHLINGAALEDLVDAPFNWQPGWEYAVSPTRANRSAFSARKDRPFRGEA